MQVALPLDPPGAPAVESGFQQDVDSCISSLLTYVSTSERRFITRALSGIALLKRSMGATAPSELSLAILKYIPKDLTICLLLGLLVVLKARSDGRTADASSLSTFLVKRALEANVRELDALVARIFFYYALSAQEKGDNELLCRNLLVAYRSCVVRGDVDCQAVLINSTLRAYLKIGQVDLAEKFASHVTFPKADNNQAARYMFYLGRIKATRGDYGASLELLFGAVRKAPQSPRRAVGFQQTVHKLLVLVQLLSGEIPERSMFKSLILSVPLAPYFALTAAVRKGDLVVFESVLAKFKSVYEKDGNYELALGLRKNVIKTGVRLINAVYSRISLKDVATILHLSSEEEAASAIKHSIEEGAIDAVINHLEIGPVMESKEMMDVYATAEPQEALLHRAKFCIQLREEAVQAMRYSVAEPAQTNPFADHAALPSGDDGPDFDGDDGGDFDDLL